MDRPESSFVIRQYYAIQIAADQIADNYTDIHNQGLESVVLYVIKRYTTVIECICNTVGKATDNE